jgi:hypothetical protein
MDDIQIVKLNNNQNNNIIFKFNSKKVNNDENNILKKPVPLSYILSEHFKKQKGYTIDSLENIYDENQNIYDVYNEKIYYDSNNNHNTNTYNNFNFLNEYKNKRKEEEKLTKPRFYNSKINTNNNNINNNINKIEEAPIDKIKYIKIEDFIQIENLVDNINIIVRDTYKNLKSMLNNKIEEEYGSLNINAETYVPKNKLLRNKMLNNNNNYNYGPNYINNNNFNNFNGQNYYG